MIDIGTHDVNITYIFDNKVYILLQRRGTFASIFIIYICCGTIKIFEVNGPRLT
jgi:hypothetical protein